MSSAPYRFIPIKRKIVVEPPLALDDIHMSRPNDQGSVSATLNITWTAMTPICVGGERAADDTVLPLRINGRYCLPGSTLRGMLRAVLETATFSHLGRINGHHHHGFRDFKGMANDFHEIAPPTNDPSRIGEVKCLKAGWLTYDRDSGKWYLRPVKHKLYQFVLTPMSALIRTLDRSVTKREWQFRPVWEKYRDLPEKYLGRPIKYFSEDTMPRAGAQFGPPRVLIEKVRGDERTFGSQYFPSKDLILVCGGPAALDGEIVDERRLKSTEALFPKPSDEEMVEIPAPWMLVFHQMNANAAREGGNPTGAWRAWLLAHGWENAFGGFEEDNNDGAVRSAMERALAPGNPGETAPEGLPELPRGIPVFWKGDLPTPETAKMAPGRQTFWLSLSRVMRVPYAYSVGETAQRLYRDNDGEAYAVPRLRDTNGWDFARALFGEIDGANLDARLGKRDKHVDDTRQEDALRGRVAVDTAWAVGNVTPERQSHSGVFSQPRESYWPFYLRDAEDDRKTRSYSSPNAIPAGRKRSIVRPEALPGTEWPQGNDNRATMTSIRFLPKDTCFTGRIRLHNLHPTEFAAILWALTFGDVDGGHWHQAGRAKGMGYGALRPDITISNLKACAAKVPPEAGEAKPLPNDLEGWLAHFEDYMTEKLADAGLPDSFRETPTIRHLIAAADPETGRRLKSSLETQDLKAFSEWRTKDTRKTNDLAAGNIPLEYELPSPDETD